MILLEKPDYVRRHAVAGTLLFAAKRIAKNLFNPSGRFFQQVIKPCRDDIEIRESIVSEDDFFIRRHEIMISEFQKLEYFEQQVIKLFLKYGSGKLVAKHTGLDYTYVKKKLCSGRKKLKSLINKKM